MSFTLHHIKNTRSLRPLWLMEEMGLDYTLVNEGSSILAMDKKAYARKNPLGKMPCFFDGDKRITESTAIIEYIATTQDGHNLIRKPGDDDYHTYLQLLHFGEAGMGGYMGIYLGHAVLLPEEHRNPAMAAWATKEINNCLRYLETELNGKDWFLGTFSIADISIAYMIFLLKLTRFKDGIGDELGGYFDRIKAREAWIKASSL